MCFSLTAKSDQAVDPDRTVEVVDPVEEVVVVGVPERRRVGTGRLETMNHRLPPPAHGVLLMPNSGASQNLKMAICYQALMSHYNLVGSAINSSLDNELTGLYISHSSLCFDSTSPTSPTF